MPFSIAFLVKTLSNLKRLIVAGQCFCLCSREVQKHLLCDVDRRRRTRTSRIRWRKWCLAQQVMLHVVAFPSQWPRMVETTVSPTLCRALLLVCPLHRSKWIHMVFLMESVTRIYWRWFHMPHEECKRSRKYLRDLHLTSQSEVRGTIHL